ncbi:MAG: hypothetical protein ACM3PT_00240 [Deltaproteobacteria bacterium]
MKTLNNFLSVLTICFFYSLVLIFVGCNKDDDNNGDNSNGQIWNENWLIGTWEGTTPSSIQPFGGKKIRIVFDKATHYETVTIGQNIIKTYFYDGTFTWDVDGSKWIMKFSANNYPDPGMNTISWQSTLTAQAGLTTNIMSIRVGDFIQTDPWHSFDLDWGPFISKSSNATQSIELYGDIEIETNDKLQKALYPPKDGSMIKLTKK